MDLSSIDDDYYGGETFTGRLEPRHELRGVTFEGCTFSNCVLDEVVLRNCDFTECRFESTSLSQARFPGTSFSDTVFNGCRAQSVGWSQVIPNAVSHAPITFESCKLTYSAFTNANLKRWTFADCDLTEADFSHATLTRAIIRNCNFLKARFQGADLRDVSLVSSYNYAFDPRDAKVQGLRVTSDGGAGLLRAFGIEIVE